MAKAITIYSTPTCGYCKMTKEFLTKKNVPFTDIDVSTDQEKAQEMVEISGQMGVPVIVIGEGDDKDILVGFDQNKLTELAEIS